MMTLTMTRCSTQQFTSEELLVTIRGCDEEPSYMELSPRTDAPVYQRWMILQSQSCNFTLCD